MTQSNTDQSNTDQSNGSESAWQAQWIWPRGDAWTVNFHGFARRVFLLEAVPDWACLRLSAYTDYAVFVNGRKVGRGPEPNDSWFQTYDTYDVLEYLTPGENVLAIAVHNYAVGTHWYNRGRGGLIAQLDWERDGKRQTLSTDSAWRVAAASCYAPNSPRAFWSAGFLETFDFGQYDPGWQRLGFNDSLWKEPEVLGPAGARPWPRLLPREIPLLQSAATVPVRAERGTFTLPPVQAVSLSSVLPPGSAGLVYARAALRSETARSVLLHIECDDAFKLFAGSDLVAEQNYSEFFARTRVWRGKDVYDQVHDGMGDGGYDAAVPLPPGETVITVAVDQGQAGWGFLLTCRDSDGAFLPFGPWTLAGPFESTGLSDSLDAVSADGGIPGAPVWTGDGTDLSVVTDYATLMGYERRSPAQPADGPELILSAGEYCIYDLGTVRVGFPGFSLQSAESAVMDIGYGQVLYPDKRLRFSNSGRMKAVDRVRLPGGRHNWQPADRRTARFLHLSCRAGQVTVRRPLFEAVGYPVEVNAAFACSDPLLNRVWEVGVSTTALLMQQGWQDCLKREQGTHNTSSFNYASRGAAVTFGDFALARKTIRQAYRGQNETGWLDSHGVSSPNSDEVTECLWLAVWLRDFVLYSGDTAFAEEVYENLEDNLRFFDKGINRHGLIEGRNRPWAWQGQGIYLDDSLSAYPYSGLFPGELSGFNLLYCAALEAAADLAKRLNLPDRAAYHAKKAARVRRSLNARLWDSAAGVYRDWRDGETLGETHHPIVQIAALYFGIGDEAQSGALLHYLTDTLGLPGADTPEYPLFTFGFYFYFLENLFRAGLDTLALTLMRRVHGRWLELGAVTFGEFFDVGTLAGKTALEDEYEVHAYGTSAHLHFTTNILGVRPLEPGFARVSIRPHPGDLQWAEGTLATPHGPISVAWKVAGGKMDLDVILPVGVQPEISLPGSIARGRITVNGKEA